MGKEERTSVSTYPLRKKLIDIARLDSGKTEQTRNRATFIEKLWPATSFPEGYDLSEPTYHGRAPYCAAGMAYCLREWLNLPDVLKALGMTPQQAEKWRCKSAGAFDWKDWAERRGLTILPKNCILHAADIVIYTYSHIEMVTDDDGTPDGGFMAIGYNTDSAAGRDGDGCFEKPRSRAKVKCFIRILP